MYKVQEKIAAGSWIRYSKTKLQFSSLYEVCNIDIIQMLLHFGYMLYVFQPQGLHVTH